MDRAKSAWPNVLSGTRIVCAALIPFTGAFSKAFYTLYFLAGFTDALDGYVARRFSSESEMGAALDSLGDGLFAAAAAWKALPCIPWNTALLLCAGGVFLIRMTTLIISFCRFQKAAFLHTVCNKLTGLILFFTVPLLSLLPEAAALPLLFAACAAAALSGTEELILMCRLPLLNRNVKGRLFRGGPLS